jgi:hypothetical protein
LSIEQIEAKKFKRDVTEAELDSITSWQYHMDLETQDQLCTFFLIRIHKSEENFEKANHYLNQLKR